MAAVSLQWPGWREPHSCGLRQHFQQQDDCYHFHHYQRRLGTADLSFPAGEYTRPDYCSGDVLPQHPRLGEKLTSVRISEGFRSSSVPVQEPGIFKLDSYVVPANTNLTISVELDRLLDDSGRTRIVVDDYYTTSDGYGQIASALTLWAAAPPRTGSNAIEYVKPFLVLKTKAPNIPTLTTFTFGLNKGQQLQLVAGEIRRPRSWCTAAICAGIFARN